MEKVAKFIVKFRYVIALIFVALIIYSAFCIGLVNVESSVTEYLPEKTDTKKALDIMEKEFVTYGTTKIMVTDITIDDAYKLANKINGVNGVKEVAFDNSEKHFKDNHALFDITFFGTAEDEEAKTSYDNVIALLDGYEIAVPTPLYDDFVNSLARDMQLILGLAAVIILIVLIFTSRSFAEILVFPFVFGTAAILNMGTNYWFGTISFVSSSVCIIMQLALAIDYSIILCHRFTEEKSKNSNSKQAMITALSKAIPEILSSCLTTIAGLIALVTMQLKLGQDLGLVLVKSIVFSILTVIFLMPTLLLWVSKLMDKTKHKNFVPKINFLGKGIIKARKVLPAIFLVVVVVFGGLSSNINYCYFMNDIESSKPTQTQLAIEKTQEIFGESSTFVILVPRGDYEKERQVLEIVGNMDGIDSALGVANIQLANGVYATDSVNVKEFCSLTNMSSVQANFLFSKYMQSLDYKGNINDFRAPLIDIAVFGVNMVDKGEIPSSIIGDDFLQVLNLIRDAKEQLVGPNYSRLVFNLNMPLEGKETFSRIEEINKAVKQIYPDSVFTGEAMSAYDLSTSFESDIILISVLTIVFVYIILMFTFKSWGLPLLLVLVIQGAIFINFGIVALVGRSFFFFIYLIVSAIQMGATIDYAILITNHYKEERMTKDKNQALVDALNASFPTIITSGVILAASAFLIGIIAGDPLISTLGTCLGIGTVISIICVMTVLPAMLYLFEDIIKKTSFKPLKPRKKVFEPPVFAKEEEAEQVDSEAVDADDEIIASEIVDADIID